MSQFKELVEEYWFVIGPLVLFLIANVKARYADNKRAQEWLKQAEQRALDYDEPLRAGDIPPPPWRLPSRARPVKRWFSVMRGFGLHRKKNGEEYRHWVRFHPNPGFKVGDKHWSVNKWRSK